jgi:hypothetical protein
MADPDAMGNATALVDKRRMANAAAAPDLHSGARAATHGRADRAPNAVADPDAVANADSVANADADADPHALADSDAVADADADADPARPAGDGDRR